VCWGTTAAAAADVAAFYKDKTVELMVPSGLGASLGLYARLLAEHLKDQIPGKPAIIVTERPGGGGVNGTTYAYNAAPRDGTFIAAILPPSVLAPALRGAKYDATRFQWLGSITPNPGTVAVWHTAPAKTLDEAKKQELVIGATAFGSETYLTPTLMNSLLGTKFKIVKGYKAGAALNKAMEQGEIQGRMSYWSGWRSVKPHWLAEKKIVHLVQYGPAIAEIPNVPRLADVVQGDDAKKMIRFLEVSNYIGIAYWMHPDTPADRLAAMRKAFADTVASESFRAAANKRRAMVDPVTPEALAKTVSDGLNVSPELVAKLKTAFGFTKK
jgi:tripartite-type tricarboxylate transporter receptor subunit TctC